MPAPIIPWSPSNLPIEIQEELDRRKTVRSFNYISNNKASWDEKGDWTAYKGPLMPWCRVCSNGAGHPAINKPRFVFNGGKGFYQTYGFQSPGSPTDSRLFETPNSNYQIIGYTPGMSTKGQSVFYSEPHIIENSLKNPVNDTGDIQSNYPIHVPTPEIIKVTVTVQKELYRRVEIEWTCFSWKQLNYMTPYFLVPGITCIIEWGWNHFNPVSLIEISDENLMVDLWKNSYPLYTNNIIQSKGNYDVVYGIVTNFNWSMEGNRINCMTEITSKDRLYAGVSKDMSLTVNNSDPDEPKPVYQALRDFISKDSNLLNLKSIAEADSPMSEIIKLTAAKSYVTGSVKGSEEQLIIWKDIIGPILSEKDEKIRGVKGPYIRGVFSGRSRKFFNNPKSGKPHKYDFDKSNVDKVDKSKMWINMGMIVEILNFFSNLNSNKGEPMFYVDIVNSVIGGHPNLISCDRNVLIPNAKSPKVHFGGIGLKNYGPTSTEQHSEYNSQKLYSQEINFSGSLSKANETLRKVCKQIIVKDKLNIEGPSSNRVCFRENIDEPINFLRRHHINTFPDKKIGNLGYNSHTDDFSFPAQKNINLPPSKIFPSTSTTGNVVEANVSGLLSNIYLSCAAFISIITDLDSKSSSYVDIYNKILSILNNAVDGFWDLTLVEVENVMTITDKNYLGTQSKLGQDINPTYSFEYSDSDSIIRSLKFRPSLSDAQATRAIYGETNNKESKHFTVDPDDLLNYQFKDAIILNNKDRADANPDPNVDLGIRNTAKQQMYDILGVVQRFNTSEDDPTLQMTINRGSTENKPVTSGPVFGGASISPATQEFESGPFEYLKLCLPPSVSKQLFRLLIDDKDEYNNQRYCAIQPGITAELTLQGIGGLRTFQYFLIKNLPSPYSHRDIIFRIIDVTHIISQEGIGWDTKITAGILPLRNYIKKRLAPPIDGWE